MRILRDESGQAIVFMALFLGLLTLGFLAFAVDVGYFFHERRMAQAAADAAVIAAAEEGGTTTNAQNAANVAATLNGFNTSQAINPATVTLSTSSSGIYSSAETSTPGNWVTAVVSQPIHTFFLGAFNNGMQKLTVAASATAAGGLNVSDCICLEGTTGEDLNMSNDAQFSGASCAIKVDSTSTSSIGVIGSANLCPEAIGVVASAWNDTSNGPNVNNGGSVCSSAKVVTSVPACDPAMPAVPTVPAYSTCLADPLPGGGGVSYTVGPSSAGGTVCYKALTVNGNGNTVTLNPGIYIINEGELHFNSGGPNLGGNGVVFFLTNGAYMSIDNGANVNLVAGGIGTASSTGTYNGILVYEDPGGTPSTDTGDSQTVSIQGGSSTVFKGAIYAPLAGINLGNGSGVTINADIVANTLTMEGGGTLTASPNTNLGSISEGGASYLAQ